MNLQIQTIRLIKRFIMFNPLKDRTLQIWSIDIPRSGGNVECVRMLLRAGAEVDAVDVKGQTSLFVAASLGHPIIMEVSNPAGNNV